MAKAAQMFRAEVALARQFIQVPLFIQAGRDILPQMPQPVIDMPRLRESQDVSVNQSTQETTVAGATGSLTSCNNPAMAQCIGSASNRARAGDDAAMIGFCSGGCW